MKHLLFLPIVLGLFSCNGSSEAPMKADSIVSSKMATENSGDSSGGKNSGRSSQNGPTKGVVLYNRHYCGAARPGKELVAKLETYHPLPNSTIILKGGTDITISTDGNGEFSAAVPPGTYEVWLTEKIDPKIQSVKPDDCIDCLKMPLGTANIVDEKAEIKLKHQ
jgi:hypothetical protein